MTAKSKTAERHSLTGTGRTLTEARQDLDEQINAALEGYYTPELVAWKDAAYLVYRELSGWHSRLIQHSGQPLKSGPIYGSQSGDKPRVIRDAKRHLAQLTVDLDAAEDTTPAILDGDLEGQREFLWWLAWQRRCRRAVKAGLSDEDARAYADYAPHATPELFALVDGPKQLALA